MFYGVALQLRAGAGDAPVRTWIKVIGRLGGDPAPSSVVVSSYYASMATFRRERDEDLRVCQHEKRAGGSII